MKSLCGCIYNHICGYVYYITYKRFIPGIRELILRTTFQALLLFLQVTTWRGVAVLVDGIQPRTTSIPTLTIEIPATNKFQRRESIENRVVGIARINGLISLRSEDEREWKWNVMEV